MMNHILLAALWSLYFFLHSFLASVSVKFFFEKYLNSKRLYRLLYSLWSTVGLFLLLIMNASINSISLFESAGLERYVSLMLTTFGLIIISRAFREYRFSSFIGLMEEASDFKVTGILKQVRHPIYSGTILIVVGFFLFNPTMATLISVSCVLVYLPIGIYLEENKLIKQFGDRYLVYKKQVPSIFPSFRRSSLKKTS